MKKSPSKKPSKKTNYSYKTLTYFIPAPPTRKNGYREKEFDRLMEGLFAEGYELIDWKITSMGGAQGGALLCFIVKAHPHSPAHSVLPSDHHWMSLHERYALSDEYESRDLERIEDHDD